MKDGEFVLSDIKKNGSQSSWDWDADLRFACHLGLTEEIQHLRAANEGNFLPNRLAHFEMVRRKITQRRLRVLRKLVHEGRVTSEWRGTGLFGKTDCGINRARAYFLKTKENR